MATTNAPNKSGRAGRTAINFYELPGNLDNTVDVVIAIAALVVLTRLGWWIRGGGFMRWRSTRSPAAGWAVIAGLVALCVVLALASLQ